MEIVSQKEILKTHVRTWKGMGKTIGFVPTMGALHQGHISLIREAARQCDVVVVSIFVNALQFNNADDLEKYPRTLKSDLKLLQSEKVALVFTPENDVFYARRPQVTLNFGPVGEEFEGKLRPGHFSGVGVVVSRLFHLVQPDKAFFGAKDLQQMAIIQTLVRDLEFDVEIVRCPTHREDSGLAMSSRNALLSKEGRHLAALLFESLKLASEMRTSMGLPASASVARAFLVKHPDISIEYINWVDTTTMQPVEKNDSNQEIAICVAARIEGVRLIDNLIV